MERYQRRDDGNGMQAICERDSKFGQRDEGMGCLHGVRFDRKEHGHLVKSRVRAAEYCYQRTTLATAHASHSGQLKCDISCELISLADLSYAMWFCPGTPVFVPH